MFQKSCQSRVNSFSSTVWVQVLGKFINKHMTVVSQDVVCVCCSIISRPSFHITQRTATVAFPFRAPCDLTRTWTTSHIVGFANAPFENFTTKQDHAVSQSPWPYHVTFTFTLLCIGQAHFSNIVISVPSYRSIKVFAFNTTELYDMEG